ncbi:MAG: 6-carboxytetrahydropterin synthase QueD [Myxococcota bacterium]|nr:6-carboxytetrahydropterin synthase QueD [Myxococcota bacterium]
MEIWKEFTFEAAHRLPNVPPEHKCARLHGHSYRARITVRGDVDPELGWVMDFDTIREAAEPVRRALDHYYLNEIEGLSNPTSEHVARWIWARLAPSLPGLCRVEVMETCTSGARYEGP